MAHPSLWLAASWNQTSSHTYRSSSPCHLDWRRRWAQPAVDTIDTRAEAAAAGRDEKSRNVSAPKRSLVERALNWYDKPRRRLQWRAVHFTGHIFPAVPGLPYGVGVTEQAMGSDFVGDDVTRPWALLFAAQSLRGYRRFGASMDIRNFLARPIDLAVGFAVRVSAGGLLRPRLEHADVHALQLPARWQRVCNTCHVASNRHAVGAHPQLSFLTAAVGSRTPTALRLNRNGVRRGQRAGDLEVYPSSSRRCLHGIRLARQRRPPAPRRPLQASLARFDGVNE